jgi:LacI family transcriptional regulator
MATIGDVARRAGVSKVTVSRVLNGAVYVNAQTRARVEQAIADLHFLPNLAARSLRSRQTQTIALVVPDITNVFWTTVARGVEDLAQKKGYSVFLGNTDENPEKQRSYLRAVAQQRVDGLIIAPYNRDGELMRPLRDQQTPIVVIDRRLDGWKSDSVRGDSAGGACALVGHLIGLGRRRIAMISGPRGASTAEDRAAGYCLALHQAGIGLDLRLLRWGEFKSVWGEQAAADLFAEGLNPDAIFAANNQIALGVWEYLLKHGLRVPQDVALVCFDEMADASRLFQFFTVAAQPAYEIGNAAAELLFARISGETDQPVQDIELPGQLILRSSCGRGLGQTPDHPGQFPFAGLKSEIRAIPLLGAEDLDLLAGCKRELVGG